MLVPRYFGGSAGLVLADFPVLAARSARSSGGISAFWPRPIKSERPIFIKDSRKIGQFSPSYYIVPRCYFFECSIFFSLEFIRSHPKSG